MFQELTEQLAVSTKLEEDLQRAKELAESAQAQYEKLQVLFMYKTVQVGNDQEMLKSERNSHSKNRGVAKN